ncbi:hypothetical protein APHAL10511_002700 [Amanita phalloides]|nr:hypothetical protein APHAL10511_002700 [Amanita phalloides]
MQVLKARHEAELERHNTEEVEALVHEIEEEERRKAEEARQRAKAEVGAAAEAANRAEEEPLGGESENGQGKAGGEE